MTKTARRFSVSETAGEMIYAILLVIVLTAFAAGYGLRSYLSHRRRRRWR